MSNRIIIYFFILSCKVLCIFIIFAVLFGLGRGLALADTSSGNVSVGALVPGCGNGIVETGESCDDGNLANGDGCSSACTRESGGSGSGSTGGDLGGGDTAPPNISTVSVSFGTSTTSLSWSATDVSLPVLCTMRYGLTEAYSLTATVLASGNENFSSSLSGLSVSSTYYYLISCADNLNNTRDRYGSFATTLNDENSPTISNIVFALGSRSATTTWNSTDSGGVSGCTFFYDQDGIYPWEYQGNVEIVNGGYSSVFGNLRSNSRYYYLITCTDNSQNSATALGNFTTERSSIPPPDAANFRASASDHAILLTWTNGEVSDLDGFILRRSQTAYPTSVLEGMLATSTNNVSVDQYLDEGLTNGVGYYYSLFVRDASGNFSNGVQASAVPGVLMDRDADGILNIIDKCDGANEGQVDTPNGTPVAANGCPLINFDITSPTVAPGILSYAGPGTPEQVSLNSRLLTLGMKPGIWHLGNASELANFEVHANGQVTWDGQFGNIFSADFGPTSTTLRTLGYRMSVDISGLNPNSGYKIIGVTGLGHGSLANDSEVRLYPATYFSVESPIAPFRLGADGVFATDDDYGQVYNMSNGVLAVHGVQICIRQNTLTGNYNFKTQYGGYSNLSGNHSYNILPTHASNFSQEFNHANPYIQSESSPTEKKNFLLLMRPTRLFDPVDGESGNAISLNLGGQSVIVGLGDCSGVNIIPCGNGTIDVGEQCDDGNTMDSDGCSAACHIETVCGNGTIDVGEQCDDGNTMDSDGCSSICQIEPMPVCGNGVLERGEQCDDGNTMDSDGCSGSCQMEITAAPSMPACNDGIDNDGDGLMDMADKGCSSPDDTSEYDIPVGANLQEAEQQQFFFDSVLGLISGKQKYAIKYKITAFLMGRTVPVELANNTIRALTKNHLTIGLTDIGTSTLEGVYLIVADNKYNFAFNEVENTYYADIIAPAPGKYDSYIEIVRSDGAKDLVAFVIESLPYGAILDSFTSKQVRGVKVTILQENGKPWNGGAYEQNNPTHVGNDGLYAFVVPNGNYSLVAEADGYLPKRTFSFRVAGNIVDRTLHLIPKSNGTLVGNIKEGAAVVEEDVKEVAGKVQDVANNPKVEKAAESVVTPVAVTATAAVVVPSLWSIIFPLLRFLFLQPLLAFGIRRRKEWGMVYNSLNRLPIDLAIVRLVEAKENKILRSQVTDKYGRYAFLTSPGHYIIRVDKQGFAFPSSIMSKVNADGLMADVYHGDTLDISDDGTSISFNIPVDPVGAPKELKRLVWESRLRILQHLLSTGGIVATTISFFIIPSLMVGAFLVLHVILYAVFLRFVKPKKPKSWGVVVDSAAGKPIEKVIVRLFNREYNKLVATELTSSKGRYAFLVGAGDYYITYEKSGFAPKRIEGIKLVEDEKSKGGTFIKQDAVLERNGGTAEAVGNTVQNLLPVPESSKSGVSKVEQRPAAGVGLEQGAQKEEKIDSVEQPPILKSENDTKDQLSAG